MDNFVGALKIAFLGIIGIAMISFVGVSIVTPDKPSFCYVEVQSIISKPTLKQNVDWGFDRTIGTFESITAAKEAAEVISCSFNL